MAFSGEFEQPDLYGRYSIYLPRARENRRRLSGGVVRELVTSKGRLRCQHEAENRRNPLPWRDLLHGIVTPGCPVDQHLLQLHGAPLGFHAREWPPTCFQR